MNKLKYFIPLFMLLSFSNVNAALTQCEYGQKNLENDLASNQQIIEVDSFTESTDENAGFDVIERNSTIIGNTKFTATEIVTAQKAAIAGYDQAIIRATSDDYYGYDGTYPKIYIYYGEIGGWYSIDKDNNATYISSEDILNNLEYQEIFAVNNVKKGIYLGETTNDKLKNNCAHLGVYAVKNGNSNAKLYASTYAEYLEVILGEKKLVFSGSAGSYDTSELSIIIEPVEGSVTGQAYIYVVDYYGDSVSEELEFAYITGGIERIVIPIDGYMIPNISAIESISFVES